MKRGLTGACLSEILCLSMSCAARTSTLQLPDVSSDQQNELSASNAAIATRYWFRSGASDYFDQGIFVNEGWLVIASYWNQGTGANDIPGGHTHDEFSVFAKPEHRVSLDPIRLLEPSGGILRIDREQAVAALGPWPRFENR